MFSKLESACKSLGFEAGTDCLAVSIGEQKLVRFSAGEPVEIFIVSTSRAEPSCVENSLGTPTGLHRVSEKIGAGEPAGMIFKGRKPQGWTHRDDPEKAGADNLITSRILRLDGLEPGKNRGGDRDSFARYIYIHGTNQSERLGTPNSHGCVVLSDDDVIRLFEKIPVGAPVWIEDDRPGRA